MKTHATAYPEWRLLCLAAHSVLTESAQERLEAMLEAPLDWDGLHRLARRHGLVPLLYRALTAHRHTRLPDRRLADLGREAAAHGKRNLLTARELTRLLALLEGKGIPALAFKGPALAAQAYDNLGARQYGDLDILVAPQDAETASEILLHDGYFSDGSIFETERPFGRRDGWVVVDLHWSLTTPLFAPLLDEVGIWQRAVSISLVGRRVRTLSAEDHLWAVALHGCKDGWRRLKSVCDVAGLLVRHPHLDWTGLAARAAQRGGRRVLTVAFALARQIIGAALPESVRALLIQDPEATQLASNIAERMLRPLPHRVVAQARQKIGLHLACLDGSYARLGYALRRLVHLSKPTRADRAALPVPGGLNFLHFFTRPFRLLWRYGLPRLSSE